MSQIQTTVSTKSNVAPNNELDHTEFNNVNATVNTNATDAETREALIESNLSDYGDRTTVIENTRTNDIPSYDINSLPTAGPTMSNGKIAFSSDMEVPIYFKDGSWYRMRDDYPMDNVTEVDMFIVMGQSNADGKADINNLDSQTSRTLASLDRSDMIMYTSSADATTGWVTTYADWSALVPGTNTAQASNRFGPEVGFADTIKAIVDGGGNATYSKPIAIMKHAKGATSLGDSWDSPNGFVYGPMTEAITDSVYTLREDGYVFNIRGMIWYQGEADASNLTYATNYEANLNSLISDIRNRFNSPNLPVILCKIGYTAGNEPTYYTEVRDALQAVSDNDSNIDIIDTESYDRRDNVHLNAKGMYELGEAIVPLMTGLL